MKIDGSLKREKIIIIFFLLFVLYKINIFELFIIWHRFLKIYLLELLFITIYLMRSKARNVFFFFND